jgi:peptidyl-prolyl cis-trans isomerase SurA
MRMDAKQLSEVLAKAGSNAGTLKTRLKADLAWQQLVRGRFSSSLTIGERDILAALETRKPEDKEKDVIGNEYTLRPIVFIVAKGAPQAMIEARKREAEALRHRFQSCDEGVAFARALRDVAVREPIVRNSIDLPAELRTMLDGVAVGRLTAPEVTKHGIQMFAVCAKRTTTESVGKRKARDAVFAERYQERAKRYLDELRRGAMIEYR